VSTRPTSASSSTSRAARRQDVRRRPLPHRLPWRPWTCDREPVRERRRVCLKTPTSRRRGRQAPGVHPDELSLGCSRCRGERLCAALPAHSGSGAGCASAATAVPVAAVQDAWRACLLSPLEHSTPAAGGPGKVSCNGAAMRVSMRDRVGSRRLCPSGGAPPGRSVTPTGTGHSLTVSIKIVGVSYDATSE
jgi:hypothetical protein